MIRALSTCGLGSLEERCLQILFVVLSIFVTIYISLFFYKKTLDYLFRELGSENTFRNSLLLSLINSIPRTLMIFMNLKDSVEDNCSFINGLTIYNITLYLPLLVLSSPNICYINQNSFLKDFLFLELAFLHSFSNTENSYYYPPLIVHLFALGLFVFFITSVFKLSDIFSGDNSSGLVEASRLQMFAFHRAFKNIYDVLILDLEGIHKFAGRINWRILASPVLNTLFIISYNGLWREDRKLLMSFLTAFILGIILIRSSKSSNLQIFVYIYAISASIMHVYLFFSSYSYLLNRLAHTYNLNINYLRTAILPLLISVVEVFTLLYYSSVGCSTLAICSLIYSTIYNMLLLRPLVNIIALKTGLSPSNSQIDCNYFCYVFGIVSSLVIIFNYIVRNHKISRDLSYNLLFTNFFFNISLLLDYRKYILK
ncbi:hypothetical protein NGRA_0352 [Nosema granulosis]|uniref:Uncharacterized protein n=1 Tax=Nosema granulosis TaxID=83296 RepID=A0A9P6H372_9MICR|nr:hypothetical protein NGRA_0352 [Nosema granulosis]